MKQKIEHKKQLNQMKQADEYLFDSISQVRARVKALEQDVHGLISDNEDLNQIFNSMREEYIKLQNLLKDTQKRLYEHVRECVNLYCKGYISSFIENDKGRC